MYIWISYECKWAGFYPTKELLYCLELWPGCLFLNSNFKPRPLNETGNNTRLAFINGCSIFQWWLAMHKKQILLPMN